MKHSTLYFELVKIIFQVHKVLRSNVNCGLFNFSGLFELLEKLIVKTIKLAKINHFKLHLPCKNTELYYIRHKLNRKYPNNF